ncbi:MAG: hypothetical protein OXR73_18740 [Myxococcales bacterium]|nr:hypothetical protein [Myxococcales bacterium]
MRSTGILGLFVFACVLAPLGAGPLSADTPPQAVAAPSAPTAAQHAATAAALPRPWTVVRAHTAEGEARLVLGFRKGNQWMLGGVIDRGHGGALCSAYPCPWPDGLTPESPLVEPPALSGPAHKASVYARTLLSFEGALKLEDDQDARQGERNGWVAELPELPEDGTPVAGLLPFLDRLRRYHPTGRCSMDSWPQRVAHLRALAAAQAGRTGWVAQGWLDTVGYFASRRMAWSSYGQRHPAGHLKLLERVGIDPKRFFVGALLDLPGGGRHITLGDARRIAPDLGPQFVQHLSALAADARIDLFNRARLFVVSATDPIEADPRLADLPPLAREIVEHWFR